MDLGMSAGGAGKLKKFLFSWQFNSALYLKIVKKKAMICLGDSHISVFEYIKANGLLQNHMLDVVEVGGATAQGLVNPNSKTDALSIFRTRLERAKKFQTILLQLGEVDCGFVIWYYAEKHNIPIEEQLSRSLSNYFSFIDELKRKGFRNIIVLSAPLPTIIDGQDWGEVANARRDIKASQKERTELTIRYNRSLAELCRKKQIRFIDTTDCLLDVNSGLIKKGFLNENRLDHHLDQKSYAETICGLLKGLPNLKREDYASS